MSEQTEYGFYFDSQKCVGCKACHIACKDRKDLPMGVMWRRVYEYAGGNWTDNGDGGFQQNIFAYYMSIGCNHCSKPVCVQACPTGAMHKRKSDGLVMVEPSICIGCESCAKACPYDAPQLDYERKVMTKCDGCYERLQEGKKPSCVESCPSRALDFDTMDNLKAKYGAGDTHIAPLPTQSITTPNLIITSNKNGQPVGSNKGVILNNSEV